MHYIKPVQIARKSAAAGLKQSRLPSFTTEEKIQLKGSADFFGINPYTAEYVREKIYDDTLVGFDTDQDTFAFQDKENWYA
jgi:lactase-phlorizin hydrolase